MYSSHSDVVRLSNKGVRKIRKYQTSFLCCLFIYVFFSGHFSLINGNADIFGIIISKEAYLLALLKSTFD